MADPNDFGNIKNCKVITKRRVKLISPYLFKGDDKIARLEEDMNRFLQKFDDVDESRFTIEDITCTKTQALIVYTEREYEEIESEPMPASSDSISGYDLYKETGQRICDTERRSILDCLRRKD